VSSPEALGLEHRGAVLGELAKLPAFLRRDLLVAWSYRLAFVSEWFSLAIQAVMFSFVGKLVEPSALPTYGGEATTYAEFAIIGVAVGAFIQLALVRVAVGIRGEQMMGTLESLLATPTAPATIQVGTVFYDLLYIPIRTALFLGLAAVALDLHFDLGGLLPALAVLVAFIPFVWGLGVANAGLILTFRRGAGIVGFGATIMTLLSGAFFPVNLLPGWAQAVASVNPLTLTIDGMREALLGGSGWGGVATTVLELVPFGIVSMAAGIAIFHLALRRERRRGTLGLY
jgi:ABC-2 type transport system permease protein